jgi:hypothetical protein
MSSMGAKMLKFPIVERQEINLVFKKKFLLGPKFGILINFIYFYFSKNLGCYNNVGFCQTHIIFYPRVSCFPTISQNPGIYFPSLRAKLS